MSCKNSRRRNAGLSNMIGSTIRSIIGSMSESIGALSGSSKIGLALFVLFLVVAVFAGAVAPYDPWLRFSPFMPPGFAHPLGTNDLGNDILSELIFGTRVSLIVGFGAAFMATIIGTVVGLLSGYFRGLADELLMGLTDVFLMIPQIPLIIVLAAFLRPSFWMTALLMGCLWWTSTSRVVRSRTLQVREMSYVESAYIPGLLPCPYHLHGCAA